MRVRLLSGARRDGGSIGPGTCPGKDCFARVEKREVRLGGTHNGAGGEKDKAAVCWRGLELKKEGRPSSHG